MNRLTQDYIVIDTNVFLHFFNPEVNINHHISTLLKTLARDGVLLVVDLGGDIEREYRRRLIPVIGNTKTPDWYRQAIRYWLNTARIAGRMRKISIPTTSKLMQTIIGIVVSRKYVKIDRLFVYVALSDGKILVTNDKKDMLRPGLNAGPYTRRDQLLHTTMNLRPQGANILDSREAHTLL